MECNASSQSNMPRKRQVEMWKRSKLKKQRYSPSGPPKKLTCSHTKKGKTYRSDAITWGDQKNFHQKFYDSSGRSSELKLKQDNVIVKYTESTPPKRSRAVNDIRGKNVMAIRYYIYKRSNKEKIQFCQKAFLDTLRISKNRIRGVVSRHFESGEMPKENRGGDRKLKLYETKKQSVIDFIKKFTVIENHYCRSKTVSRQYLNSDLNIKKMWRFYDAEMLDETKKVKPSYFRHIFRTNFNIGFGSPATDACSTCISLNEKIKNCKDTKTKEKLICEKRCHKLKGKAFYSLLREEREDLLISFDCQKNQVLPRVLDQSAYYSRQLYKYNLTVVVGGSRCTQTKSNVFIYDWDESEQKEGSNEVSSAVYHCLLNLHIPETIKVLRIVSDGCGGQNKNTTMMGMLSFWFLHNAPQSVEKFEYIFPIVGHSFLPSDRVFARIEKEVRKTEIIISPDEYTAVFSHFGTVVSLAGKVFDWKNTVQKTLRPPAQWHFQFNPCKIFCFKRNPKTFDVLIKGEVHYRTELGQYMSVSKKGKSVGTMLPPTPVEVGVILPPLKLRDVSSLLAKHFGDDWGGLQSLLYYKNILETQAVDGEETAEEVEHAGCTRMEECDNLVV